MRDKAETGLQLIARWTDESGIERERTFNIEDISKQGSFMIELKALDISMEESFVELDAEGMRLQENFDWLQGNFPKNTRLWIEKKAPDYYHNVMKAYWDYYDYQINEEEKQKETEKEIEKETEKETEAVQ